MNCWIMIKTKDKNDYKEVENAIYQLFSKINIKNILCKSSELNKLYSIKYDLKPNKNCFPKIHQKDIIGLSGWIKDLSTNEIYSSILNDSIKNLNIYGHIVGEFSICLIKNKEIIIATDYYSTNPVYYFIDETRLVYTNDLRILLILSFIQYGINHEALKFSLSKDFCINEFDLSNNDTFFLNIKKMRENTLVKINYSGDIKENNDFLALQIDKSLNYLSMEETVILFKDKLNKCTKDRINAGINGLMLSGGIDSSSLLGSIISNKLIDKIHNYTISFPDKSLSLSQDKFIIDKFIEEVNISHSYIELGNNLRLSNKDDYLYNIDGPIPDANPIALIEIAKKALSSDIEYLMTGEGGDVVLGEATEDYLVDLILKKHGFIYSYKYLKKMGYESTFQKLLLVIFSTYPKLAFYLTKYFEDSSRDVIVGYLNHNIINDSKYVMGDYFTIKKYLKNRKFQNVYQYYIYTHLYPKPAYLTSSTSLFANSYPLLDTRMLNFSFSINPLFNVDYEKSNIEKAYEHSKILARKAFKEELPSYIINKKRKTLYALMSRKMFQNSSKEIYNQAYNPMKLAEYDFIDQNKYLNYIIGYILQVKDENFDLGLIYQYVRITYEAEMWASRFDTNKKNIIDLVSYRSLI